MRKAVFDIAQPYVELGAASIKPLGSPSDPAEVILYEIELKMAEKAKSLRLACKDMDLIVSAVAAEFLRNLLPLLLVCMQPVRSAA